MFPLCPSQSSAMADPESTTNDFIYVEDIMDLQLDAIDAVDLGLAQGEEQALEDSLDESLLRGNYDDALSEDVLLDLEELRRVLAPLIEEFGPQQESNLPGSAGGSPVVQKTSTPKASPSLSELVVTGSERNIPIDPTFASWADEMEANHQLATIPMPTRPQMIVLPEVPQKSILPEVPQKSILPELPQIEVSEGQAVHPLPSHNVPYCYTLDSFQKLPFRHQKEFSFRCRKTLETDAFGEAQPLSDEVKASLRMQIDEFDREKRRRASKAREAPPQKPRNPGPIRSHSRHVSSQNLQNPKVPSPPSAAVSRLREPLISSSSQLPIKALPPSTPPPVANEDSLRESLDAKVIKDMLRERADSYTAKAIAANVKKVTLQEQSEILYARARKAEIARSALDQPESIIIEMVEERVAALRKEAEALIEESKVADAEARQFFAQASATQGTANRYQASTATPRQRVRGPPQVDRRPHPYQRNGSRASRGWNHR
jgi:hypothetical protein